jgi:hypothetical protein
MYGLLAELSEKEGVTCWTCWVGEDSGEPLESEERSEEEWIDCSFNLLVTGSHKGLSVVLHHPP